MKLHRVVPTYMRTTLILAKIQTQTIQSKFDEMFFSKTDYLCKLCFKQEREIQESARTRTLERERERGRQTDRETETETDRVCVWSVCVFVCLCVRRLCVCMWGGGVQIKRKTERKLLTGNRTTNEEPSFSPSMQEF